MLVQCNEEGKAVFMGGKARAGDIKKYGLFKATIMMRERR